MGDWTFSNRRASPARVRPDWEIVIALTPVLDTSANRVLIDASLPSGASRITGIRAGMTQGVCHQEGRAMLHKILSLRLLAVLASMLFALAAGLRPRRVSG
jgi:hypothetical protein